MIGMIIAFAGLFLGTIILLEVTSRYCERVNEELFFEDAFDEDDYLI